VCTVLMWPRVGTSGCIGDLEEYVFDCQHSAQNASGVYPVSCSVDTVARSPGGEVAGSEADCSRSFSADVKNAWSYTSTP
jgi:hypothetical protein